MNKKKNILPSLSDPIKSGFLGIRRKGWVQECDVNKRLQTSSEVKLFPGQSSWSGRPRLGKRRVCILLLLESKHSRSPGVFSFCQRRIDIQQYHFKHRQTLSFYMFIHVSSLKAVIALPLSVCFHGFNPLKITHSKWQPSTSSHNFLLFFFQLISTHTQLVSVFSSSFPAEDFLF